METFSVEADELASARTRIAQLEAELALTRDACAVRRAASGCPKRKCAIVEGLIARGHSSRAACRVTGLNRSTYHAHRRRCLSDRAVRRLVVADEIETIHRGSRGRYRERRIRAALLEECGLIVNVKLVAAIMRERGLASLPRPRTRKPNLLGVDAPADLVQRRFTASRPDELWLTGRQVSIPTPQSPHRAGHRPSR